VSRRLAVMQDQQDRKQLRSFGLMVGGVFALIALWPVLLRGGDPRLWAAILAILLVIPALLIPGSLRGVYKGWMALGQVLGWINTRIILGAVFYLVVTPIGLLRRLLGKDPMGKKLKSKDDSYRVLRTPRSPSHLTRQY
jgi:saxitoxin biosynthesis operon SxtJ-like protein